MSVCVGLHTRLQMHPGVSDTLELELQVAQVPSSESWELYKISYMLLTAEPPL